MPLTPKQKHYLRALSHKLKPIVMVGNSGTTENIINEIDLGLAHHELIKVRISGMERKQRTDAAADLCHRTGSELINIIGHIIVLYRPAETQQIKLP